MSIYTVIGLHKTQQMGNTYMTNERGRILHDETGKAMSISRMFDHDTLFVQCDDIYYAIRLYLTHGASFEKHASLVQFGHMSVEIIDASYLDKHITHLPLQKDLAFQFELPVGICDFEGDMDIYSHVGLSNSEWSPRPEWIFRFSHAGGDEVVPYGSAEVNMELFHETPPRTTYTRLPDNQWSAYFCCAL